MAKLSDQSFLIENMMTAACLKIFLNYSQTISILDSFNLNWDTKLLEIFNIHKVASGGLQEVASIECFFAGMMIDFLK